MSTGKWLVFAAFGAAVVLLFTTDRGKEIREEIEDAAGDLGDTLGDLLETATASAGDLKKLLGKEIAGLTDDARGRIMAILDEGAGAARKMKNAAAEHF